VRLIEQAQEAPEKRGPYNKKATPWRKQNGNYSSLWQVCATNTLPIGEV